MITHFWPLISLRYKCILFFVTALACSRIVFADTDHVTIREGSTCHHVADSLSYVNTTDATIASPSDARVVLDAIKAVAADPKVGAPLHLNGVLLNCDTSTPHHGPIPAVATTPNFDANDFYCLIHVLLWKNPATNGDTTKPMVPDKQNWYVYHAGNAWRYEDFKARNRLFGSKNIWLLFVHINARTNYTYEVRYDFDIKDVIPTPLNDALALASLAAGGSGQTTSQPVNIWGMYPIQVNHLPNEMTVQPEIYGSSSSSGSGAVTLQNISDTPTKFVNEGRYHVDFGVAVPVKGISQTTISTTNGTLTPKTTTTQNAFAVIDLYPYPNDVRNTTFSYFPYAIIGVATASQPLHKILLAAGWGPAITQLYVGALLVKQQKSSATPAQPSSGYEPQFSIGINLSVRAFNGLLKKTK